MADNLKKRIASITEPNGTFDTDKRTLLAGEPVTVSFSYRNASRACVAVRPVDMKRWQEERMDKVQTSKTLGKLTKTGIPTWGTCSSACCMTHPMPAIWGRKSRGMR